MAESLPPLFALVGFTASGKKKVGIETARLIDAEIISLDSMKVYRGMDIGTAKPTAADRARARFHMLDLVEPCQSFSVGRFLERARVLAGEITARGRRVLFLGGTAFYLNALVEGIFEAPASSPELRQELLEEAENLGAAHLHGRLRGADPEAAESIHRNDIKRIVRALEVIASTGRRLSWLQKHRTRRVVENPVVLAGLRRPAARREERIRARTARMIAAGLVDEVRRILAAGGFGPESGKAIGYREILAHLEGRSTLAEAEEAINRNTLAFVRKQEAWYRRWKQIEWFELDDPPDPSATGRAVAEYFVGRSRVPAP